MWGIYNTAIWRFEDTERNIEKLIEEDINDYNLPYYIYHYGRKDKAQQYFNKIIKNSELRSMYIDFYNQLKEIPKENISLGVSEFYGSTMIEFAYINGIIIEEE